MANYKVIGGDHRQYGPITTDELRQWIAEGRLNGSSLVQLEGSAEWLPLATFGEFAVALGTLVPPPPTGAPPDPAGWTNQILAREPELRLGECLRSGVSFFAANAGFVLAAVFITWLIKVLMTFTPFIGGIIHLVLGGVVTGGLYLACLRRMHGEPAGVGSVFDGFKLCFVQLMLAGAISGLLTQLSFLLCVLPGIYLGVAWVFALPLVADKRLEFWSAMELSRKVVTRVWFPMLLLLLIVFLPVIAVQILAGIKFGSFVLATLNEANFDALRWLNSLPQHFGEFIKMFVFWAVVGQVALLVCQFFAVGALMRAYENLFGARKT